MGGLRTLQISCRGLQQQQWRSVSPGSELMEIDSEECEIRAEVKRSAAGVQVLTSAKMYDDLRQMVNDPVFSDVVFMCKDRNRVQGSRHLLACKSDVLKNMFMESRLSEIALPQISSSVLLCVFEFIYTGTMFDYQPQNWKMAAEVIAASRFFHLPELERITQEFMRTVLVADHAASVLTGALGSMNL